jgi:hypothetical protein
MWPLRDFRIGYELLLLSGKSAQAGTEFDLALPSRLQGAAFGLSS